MKIYRYDDIIINGRIVSIKDIVVGAVNGESQFEQKTFEFITHWMQGKDSFIQHTSGSTGTPKPIMITRSQMIASARMSINALGLKEGFTSLLCISPDYIGGKMMLVRSFIAGMKIVACTPSANPFSKLTVRDRIDFAAMVPYQIQEILLSDERSRFNEIKTVIIGGAPIDTTTEKKLHDYSCVFYSTYGMTETISHIALQQLNGNNASGLYRTLPGIRIYTDERGCLVIEWDHLSRQIVTNDLVEIVGREEFRWIGRWDNIINTGGVKVSPEKVESVVREIFSKLQILNSFFVGSVADVKLGRKIILFIEGQLTNEMIHLIGQEIARRVTKHEAPKEIVLIKSFILTENGKINRKATTTLHEGQVT